MILHEITALAHFQTHLQLLPLDALHTHIHIIRDHIEKDLNNTIATNEALRALHGHLTLSTQTLCPLTPWKKGLSASTTRPKRQALAFVATVAFLLSTVGSFFIAALDPTPSDRHTSYQKVTAEHIFELSISLNRNIQNLDKLTQSVAVNADIMHTSLVVHILLDELKQFTEPSLSSPIAKALLSNAHKPLSSFTGSLPPPHLHHHLRTLSKIQAHHNRPTANKSKWCANHILSLLTETTIPGSLPLRPISPGIAISSHPRTCKLYDPDDVLPLNQTNAILPYPTITILDSRLYCTADTTKCITEQAAPISCTKPDYIFLNNKAVDIRSSTPVTMDVQCNTSPTKSVTLFNYTTLLPDPQCTYNFTSTNQSITAVIFKLTMSSVTINNITQHLQDSLISRPNFDQSPDHLSTLTINPPPLFDTFSFPTHGLIIGSFTLSASLVILCLAYMQIHSSKGSISRLICCRWLVRNTTTTAN